MPVNGLVVLRLNACLYYLLTSCMNFADNYSVWPKVSNQHGGNVENLKPKSTTKSLFSTQK